MKITTVNYDVLDSTNTQAIIQARKGADEGVCVIAREQTAGRGRHGRAWSSGQDSGLYFSIILRPILELEFLPLVTLMFGVAVHETLNQLNLSADIKWVNDVLVKEKKIAGILAETTETTLGLAVIAGVGINLRAKNFPREIADIATSIESELGGPVDKTEVLSKMTSNLDHFYEILQHAHGPEHIRDEWAGRSTYFKGKSVRAALPNEFVEGITDGLEPNGALRITKPDGSTAIVQAGDVEKLRAEPA